MRALPLVYLLLAPLLVVAQSDWKKIATVPIGKAHFVSDNIGQLYSVQGDMLKRYNNEGQLQYNYNNKTFGNITFVDPTNPLRVVVFYQELSQVVFLDNTLSEHGTPISLTELGYDQTTVLCASQNNGLWLFDQVDFELIWLNDNAEVQKESGNLIQQLGYELDPNFMIERHNWLYLNDPDRGILVFDIFGTYFKTIPLKGLGSFQVTETHLLHMEEGVLKAFDFKLLDAMDVPLPEVPASEVQVQGPTVFMRELGEVQVYRHK